MVKKWYPDKARKEKAKKNTDIKRFYVSKNVTLHLQEESAWLKNFM
jgi:hypothetical protein